MTDNEIIKTFAEATKDALDLIERQQAEIERLKFQLAVKDKKIECLCGIAGAIRKQSIEKFAEKLKAEYEGYDETYHQIFYSSLVKAIDKIADEMTGKENKNA